MSSGPGWAAHFFSFIYVAWIALVPVSLAIALVWSRKARAGSWYVTAIAVDWALGHRRLLPRAEPGSGVLLAVGVRLASRHLGVRPGRPDDGRPSRGADRPVRHPVGADDRGVPLTACRDRDDGVPDGAPARASAIRASGRVGVPGTDRDLDDLLRLALLRRHHRAVRRSEPPRSRSRRTARATCRAAGRGSRADEVTDEPTSPTLTRGTSGSAPRSRRSPRRRRTSCAARRSRAARRPSCAVRRACAGGRPTG